MPLRTRRRGIPDSVRREVAARDGGRCRRCGAYTDAPPHHVVPRGRGGKDTPENLILLCPRCHAWVHDTPGGVDAVIRWWNPVQPESFAKAEVDLWLRGMAEKHGAAVRDQKGHVYDWPGALCREVYGASPRRWPTQRDWARELARTRDWDKHWPGWILSPRPEEEEGNAKA